MKFVFPLLFVLFFVVSGCGGKTISLHGKITFADDGSPLNCGTVYFDSASVRSKAVIKENGTYVAGTLQDTDGIPPGTYSVSIVGAEEPGTPGTADSMTILPGKPLIAPKYANASTSGLTLTVDGKTKTFDIKVERPKK